MSAPGVSVAAAGVHVVREPVPEPWGQVEMWIEDPDGAPVVLFEVPAGHPLRRDQDDSQGDDQREGTRVEAAARACRHEDDDEA